MDELVTKLRCAEQARSCGMPAAGSAMRAPGGVLLIEWPLPWPRDIGEVDELAPVVAAATTSGVRPLLVQGAEQPGTRRLVCFHRAGGSPPGTFSGYLPAERSCQAGDVASVALALLNGAPGRPGSTPLDVVVCTHGRRDRCCGAGGVELHRALLAGGLPTGVRVWRSSHHGGHHLAPTALVLPDGTSWSHLDATTVVDIVERRVPPAQIIGRFRGCTGLADPQGQVLDGVAVAQVGWSWLDRPREVRRHGPTHVEVIARCPDAGVTSCAGIVEGRSRPLPACGSIGDDAIVEHRVHEVMAYRLDPAPAAGARDRQPVAGAVAVGASLRDRSERHSAR